MRLSQILTLELRYDSPPARVRLGGSPFGWGYGTGTGTVRGSLLTGNVRWTNTPAFRPDDVGIPKISGVIATEDGSDVLIFLTGYAVPDNAGGRVSTYAVRFLASADRYRQLNTMIAVAEAYVLAGSDALHAEVYECIAEIG